MGSSAIKNPRRIFSQNGGAIDPSIETRIETLENNEYQIIYWAPVSSDAGTITKPTNSTIILDQFQGGADAFVTTIVNGQPSGEPVFTAGGVRVDVSSFDASGTFALNGTPSAFDVALVYIIQIKAKDYANVNPVYEVERYEVGDFLEKTRTISVTTATTIILDANNYDQYNVLALASNLTIANPTGSFYNGQKIIYRLKDNGTSRTLTFGSDFNFSSDLTAPTTTTINRYLYLGFCWNSTTSKWDNLAQLNNFS